MKVFANKAAYLLLTSGILFASRVDGQLSPLAVKWKDHFKATPVIENCVFERDCPASKDLPRGETNLYQFRFQTNAFMMRQIRNLDDIASDYIPTVGDYAGGFESNYWTIKRELRLFPNAQSSIEEGRDGDAADVFIPKWTFFAALYYGISNLDPNTVEWTDEFKFTGRSFQGYQYSGEVLETSNGLPTVLEWHEANMQNVLEYKYDKQDANHDLPYYPSEIRVFVETSGQKQLLVIYKIMILKTAAAPLGEEFFDPQRYYVKSKSSLSTLVFTNNQIYVMATNGVLEGVLDTQYMPAIQKSPDRVRLFFVSFLVLSLIIMFFKWKHMKKSKNQ